MNELIGIALSKYGTKEILGEKHNADIVKFAKEAGFPTVNDDETAWCSIFMNWVAYQGGMERSKRMDARSWLNIGTPVLLPEMGDVVILKRGDASWQGHVGIFISQMGDDVFVLGGNQSNMVNISSFKSVNVLGYRKLRKLNMA